MAEPCVRFTSHGNAVRFQRQGKTKCLKGISLIVWPLPVATGEGLLLVIESGRYWIRTSDFHRVRMAL